MATTALDDRLVPKAKNLIDKYGKSVIFTISTPSYDKSTGLSTVSTVAHTRKITPPQEYSTRYIDGKNVIAGDLSCFLAAQDLGFVPNLKTAVTVDGTKFQIVRISPTYTGEQVAMYELQLRR